MIACEKGVSYLFITDDLAVAAEIADGVTIMYQGKVIKQGGVAEVLTQPRLIPKNCWRLCRF
ncbi:hypothetical protein [Methylobacter sp.]|uniref:hypothetical protein n=1 Tax=Methylobacter sp. TaxID=2051955 RepID=UPI0025DD7D23|nr:hypothetical protein [Methylobacter sp.]